nr:glycoside hydrolase family 88 protein [uncultured Clostridium sp.]
MNYFNGEDSAYAVFGDRDREVIALLANRFIGENPQAPYQYRLDFTSGILCDTKGWYLFDFERRFPQAQIGDICYGAGDLYSHEQTPSRFEVRCQGPVVCYVNGEEVFRSLPGDESFKTSAFFSITLLAGLNHFVLFTEKTEIGFGFALRNAKPQWEPPHFLSPVPGRNGQAGFVYSEPVKWDSDRLKSILSGCYDGMTWFPCVKYDKAQSCCPITRIFGSSSEGTAVLKSGFFLDEAKTIHVTGRSNTKVRLFIDGNLSGEWQNGTWESGIMLQGGTHSLLVLCLKQAGEESGFDFRLEADGKAVSLSAGVKGYEGQWLYTGMFGDDIPPVSDLLSMEKVYPGKNGTCFWKTDLPDSFVRIFSEEELYGKWTYPCGVTLYGLLTASRYFNRADWQEYVLEYARMTAAAYDYSLYDKSIFGYPGVNTQLCWLSELDDCGSFGSFLLEAYRYRPSSEAERLADVIADFMRNRQRREKDMVFSRNNNTMWIDDMYMSIPFLCRYYKLSEDRAYLDDACRQAKLFKQYFFMTDKKLMSHIIDLTYGKMNRIPWSRGNGWVVLALSELLLILPKEHPDYDAVTSFFLEMTEGILQVQDETGMWHQILDDPSTYEEASSTSMFICAFSRGIRLGIITEDLRIRCMASITRAWTGMKKTVINRKGDLYGVCRGSDCSYSRSYYRQLGWRFNDPHGIGIAVLAGVEKLMLDEFLQNPASC